MNVIMPHLLPWEGASAAEILSTARKNWWIWALLALLVGAVLFASTPTAGAQVLAPPVIETSPGGRIVDGEIIVRFKPGTSEETRDQALAAVDGIYAGTVPLPQGSEIVVARVPVGTEAASAESLTIDTNVLAAQPNIIRVPG
jgi:hypothetical protein